MHSYILCLCLYAQLLQLMYTRKSALLIYTKSRKTTEAAAGPESQSRSHFPLFFLGKHFIKLDFVGSTD